MPTSHKRHLRDKAVTVRLPAALLKRLMRTRQIATQSELIHTLLREEEERCKAEAVLQATAGTVNRADFDARLL